MNNGKRIAGLSGSLSLNSKTKVLVSTIGEQIARETASSFQMIDIAALAPHLGIRSRTEALPDVEQALTAIENADLLVAASPIYKGSYTGLFKHFIDLVDYGALQGTPVALIATGGSDRHALAVDHLLRPLFTFFLAHTLPTGVFVPERAIVDGTVSDEAIRQRLEQLVREGVKALRR